MAFVAISHFTKDYLIKQKIIPDTIQNMASVGFLIGGAIIIIILLSNIIIIIIILLSNIIIIIIILLSYIINIIILLSTNYH